MNVLRRFVGHDESVSSTTGKTYRTGCACGVLEPQKVPPDVERPGPSSFLRCCFAPSRASKLIRCYGVPAVRYDLILSLLSRKAASVQRTVFPHQSQATISW